MTAEFFATICFLVLMQNGKGLKDKAPSYIEEKQTMLNMGWDAFGELDSENQMEVRLYCERWHVDVLFVKEQPVHDWVTN